MFTRINPIWTSLRFEGDGGAAGAAGGSTDNLPPELAEVFDSLAEDGEDGKKFVKLTQDRLTKLALSTKTKAQAQTLRKVAEDLGMSVDDAKQLITDHKAAIEASKTDLQREKDAADVARKEADADKQTVAQERHDLRVEKALLKAGVDPVKAEKARRLVDAEVGSDQASIDVAVESVKADFPSIFEADKETKNKVPSGTPGGPPPKKLTPEGALDRGKQRAMDRMPHKQAS